MTDQKLEALVGHLFVAGGHPLQSTPLGTQVALPPRRAHRAREEDTLFVLITSAGRKPMPSEMYNDLAKRGADSYFKSRVGVTGALRDALVAINDQLARTEYRAGALLLAKRSDDVYVARSGTTLCAVRGEDHYETFPGDPELLNILPLGSRSEPMMEFTRFPLAPGNVYVLGDAGFASISDQVLEACISKGNIEQVLDHLETVVTKDATATIIQFVLPDEAQEPTGDMETSSPDSPPTSSPSPEPSLPVSNPATQVARQPALSETDVDVMVEERAQMYPPEAHPEPEADQTVSPLPPEMPPIDFGETVEPSDVPDDDFLPYREAMETVQSSDDSAHKTTSESIPGVSTLETEPVSQEPISSPDAGVSPQQHRRRSKRQATKLPSQTVPQGRTGIVLRTLGSVLRAFSTFLNRLLPEPDEDTAQNSIPLGFVALIAILIPAVIAIVVVGFSISDRSNTRFEELRVQAINAYDEAEEYAQAEAADRKTARELWAISRSQITLALNENPDDDELRTMLRESLLKLDFYDRVRRVEVSKMREFGENADLRGPVLAANRVDLYVLDRNRGQVFRNTLNSAGNEIIGGDELPVIQRGQRIRENTVANLIDIMWMDEGGAAQRNALVALDENGLLVSYSPVFPPADGLNLVTPPDWRRPVAIAQWSVNLYVLDAGANQIWRYVPSNGFYSQLPEEYFTGSERPDLARAVDLAIDEQGVIYVLFQNGRVEKYLSGEPESFDLFEGPVDGLQNTHALFVDNDPVSYALYVGDRENEALYQVSLGGRVNDGYRPSTTPLDAFNDVSGVFVDSASGRINVYVLSGNSLYYLQGN